LGRQLAINALENVRESHGLKQMLDGMQDVFEKAAGIRSTRESDIARHII
jgi:hypothetical protein